MFSYIPPIHSLIAFIAYGNGKKIYTALKNAGSASIGYVPPLPATWSTMTTTASAFPISPKDMVREYMSSENVRLVTAPVAINETGCTHCILSRYKSPSTMIKVCTCDSKKNVRYLPK